MPATRRSRSTSLTPSCVRSPRLERNYRSTVPILETSNAVIAQSPQRHPKTLWTDRTLGERPQLRACLDERRHGLAAVHRATQAARTKPRVQRLGHGRAKLDVLEPGALRLAGRTTEDAGRLHTSEESPVVTNVTRANRPIIYCVIKLHPLTVSQASDAVWRFSDLVAVWPSTQLMVRRKPEPAAAGEGPAEGGRAGDAPRLRPRPDLGRSRSGRARDPRRRAAQAIGGGHG